MLGWIGWLRWKFGAWLCSFFGHKWKLLAEKGSTSAWACLRCRAYSCRLDLRPRPIRIGPGETVIMGVRMPLVPGKEAVIEVLERKPAEENT